MSESKNPEPRAEILGGPSRPSTTVDRSQLPAIAARERVTGLLQGHDLVEGERAFDQLTDADQAIVRLIAQEGAMTGTEPAVRYKAIAALAHHPSADNLNLLTDMARFGEDFYVRGHALLALGRTGSYAHLEPILRGLDAEEPFERTAAGKALALLAQRSSVQAILAHATALGGEPARERAETRLAEAPRRGSTPNYTDAGRTG